MFILIEKKKWFFQCLCLLFTICVYFIIFIVICQQFILIFMTFFAFFKTFYIKKRIFVSHLTAAAATTHHIKNLCTICKRRLQTIEAEKKMRDNIPTSSVWIFITHFFLRYRIVLYAATERRKKLHHKHTHIHFIRNVFVNIRHFSQQIVKHIKPCV